MEDSAEFTIVACAIGISSVIDCIARASGGSSDKITGTGSGTGERAGAGSDGGSFGGGQIIIFLYRTKKKMSNMKGSPKAVNTKRTK